MPAPDASRTAAAPTPGHPLLGLVTIGQAPRTDLTGDIAPLLTGVRAVEHGALDLDRFDGTEAEANRTRREVGPVEGEAPLISRLRDGSSVVLGHDALAPRMRDAVARCEADGAGATLLLCTGNFPSVPSAWPLLYAEPLVQQGVRAVVGAEPVGIVCPLPAQREDVGRRWARLLEGPVRVEPADPYGEDAAARVAEAAGRLVAGGSRWLVLDCIGYTEAMRAAACAAVGPGHPVLLARALAVRLASEVATATATGPVTAPGV
ncbi:AroM family protein [Streptomyces daliensis]